MSLLAAWLVGIGVLDLVAGAGGLAVSRRRGVAAVAAGTAAGAVAAAVALAPLAATVVAPAVALPGAGWLTARGAAGPRSAAAALVATVGIVGAPVAGAAVGAAPFAGAATPVARGHLPVGLVLVTVGAGLCLVGTANVVVRLLLRLADVDAVAAGTRLRGGRVIGPLERLVLFGLGLAGGWIAAGFVVAAKSLLRLSELRAGDEPAGPSRSRDERMEVLSEYVLLGSLASWALALTAVGLVRLAA